MSEKKNIKLISKNEAKAKGLKKYYTGIPCKEGHLSERYVSSSNCMHVTLSKENLIELKHIIGSGRESWNINKITQNK